MRGETSLLLLSLFLEEGRFLHLYFTLLLVKWWVVLLVLLYFLGIRSAIRSIRNITFPLFVKKMFPP
jgi:hypothetical protein